MSRKNKYSNDYLKIYYRTFYLQYQNQCRHKNDAPYQVALYGKLVSEFNNDERRALDDAEWHIDEVFELGNWRHVLPLEYFPESVRQLTMDEYEILSKHLPKLVKPN